MTACRIVIVEDNAADVLLVEEALKQTGIDCTLQRFMNGEDAAKAIPEMSEAPNLFVVDLNLPRVHGLELVRLIRSIRLLATAPIAILTSSRAPGDKTKSEKLGANAYIIKPTGYNEFVDTVGGTIFRLLKSSVPSAYLWRKHSCLPRRHSCRRLLRRKYPTTASRRLVFESDSPSRRSCAAGKLPVA